MNRSSLGLLAGLLLAIAAVAGGLLACCSRSCSVSSGTPSGDTSTASST